MKKKGDMQQRAPESRSGLWGLALGLLYEEEEEEEEDAMVSVPGGVLTRYEYRRVM